MRFFLSYASIWRSLDPLFLVESELPNGYSYADNDPINNYDPSGLICIANCNNKTERTITVTAIQMSKARIDKELAGNIKPWIDKEGKPSGRTWNPKTCKWTRKAPNDKSRVNKDKTLWITVRGSKVKAVCCKNRQNGNMRLIEFKQDDKDLKKCYSKGITFKKAKSLKEHCAWLDKNMPNKKPNEIQSQWCLYCDDVDQRHTGDYKKCL